MFEKHISCVIINKVTTIYCDCYVNCKGDILRGLLTLTSFFASFLGGICLSDNFFINNKKYILHSEKVKENTRFVYLSDLHGRYFSYEANGRDFDYLLDKIRKADPEYILIGGDLVTVKFETKIYPCFELLKELVKDYPVYYAIGNHENNLLWCKNKRKKKNKLAFLEFLDELDKIGVHVVDNDKWTIEEKNITVHGISLEREFYNKRLNVKLTKKHCDELVHIEDKDSYNILLAHNPEYFYAYKETGMDLCVSGHYHGGVMKLPKGRGFISPRFKLFKPDCYGIKKSNGVVHIISAGLGMHTIPIRLFNHCEIVTIDILKKENK